MKLCLVIVFVFVVHSVVVQGEDALIQTQQLLKEKKQRKAALKSEDAKKADDYTSEVTGHSEILNDDIYKLASEVFSQLTENAKGDPKKMKELAEEYARDPSSFAEKWTPEQKKKLHDLSVQVPQPIQKN